MPELPEVETVRRGLARQLQNFDIHRVVVLRERAIAGPQGTAAFCAALTGCRIAGWQRRGKYLLGGLVRNGFEAGRWGVHLRMTGQFLWLDGAQDACAHTRVRIFNGSGQELRFVDVRSFAQMWWVPPGTAAETVITGLARLGPEPFSEDFHAAYLQGRLKGSLRPIKSALLDQGLLAGVGNIYADESLFAAGINPHRASGKIPLKQLQKLHDAIVQVLEVSIGAGGTTFSDFRDLSGTNGNYGGMAWVYRRGGEPCRTCQTPIRRDRLSGRSTHWCPNCQH